MQNIFSLYDTNFFFNRYVQPEIGGGYRNVLGYDNPQVYHFFDSSFGAWYTETDGKRMQFRSLKTLFNDAKLLSPRFDHDSLMDDHLKIICLTTKPVSDGLEKGTVSLKWYQNGTLLAEASDSRENGELHQTYPAIVGDSLIGYVLYSHGIIVLFATDSLGGDAEAFFTDKTKSTLFGPMESYDTPVDPSWVGFFNPGNDFDVGACNKSVFEIHATSTNKIYSLMFDVGLKDLNWSTNPTFSSEGGGLLATKSRVAETALSSGVAPYVFVDTIDVYDSARKRIGFVELAQPLFFKNGREYSVKVKIDF